MAGAGYKLFNTGDVLTAAQVNTYLQEQAVMRFANSTARTTALSGVLAEGMMSYLDDTNSVEVYNGSAWVSIGSSGDITGVTAGTGLSGGGSSGDVTLSLSTPVSATNGGTAQTSYATGDLLYASAADTLTKRAIGTSGQVLTVSGGVPTWATPAGGGKLLQLVNATYATSTTLSTTTWTDIGLSASITPASSANKILVMISIPLYIQKGTQADAYGSWKLLRGSTDLIGMNIIGNTTGADPVVSLNYHWYDNPATTSSTTYKVQGKVFTAGMNATFQYKNSVFGDSTITLMEIGA